MKPVQTPVVLIIFKRLDTTRRVVEAIRKARPKKLYIIADGGRNDAEQQQCAAVRKHVEQSVDWDCEIIREYAETNMGTKRRIVSGIDLVFAREEQAIILEDDTVPNLSFFHFCEELLERYRNDAQIMQIAGANFQKNNRSFSAGGTSYYFSQFPEIWGWATWRRAWELFDEYMKSWPDIKAQKKLTELMPTPEAADYWEYLFDQIYAAGDNRQKSDVWAAQWVYTCLVHNGLSITPEKNLVTNIGIGEGATRNKGQKGANIVGLPTEELPFPLRHPDSIRINIQADLYSLTYGWKIKNTLREKILFFLKHRTPSLHMWLKRTLRNYIA